MNRSVPQPTVGPDVSSFRRERPQAQGDLVDTSPYSPIVAVFHFMKTSVGVRRGGIGLEDPLPLSIHPM